MAKIGALIAAALGGASDRVNLSAIREKTKLGVRTLDSYFRHARRGGGNNGRFTRELRRRFAKNALARYGLDEFLPSGGLNWEHHRQMRNARKQERRAS